MTSMPASAKPAAALGVVADTPVPDLPGTAGAFSLLLALNGDAAMADVFSAERTVESWLEAERALACAQASVGDISHADAEAITKAARTAAIDLPRLLREARNVGYPILPLVRQVTEQLPAGPDGRMHYGATTQDIMDTGLVLQLAAAIDRLDELVSSVATGLARLVDEHRATPMAARTHALQAVPTTLGAKLAVFLMQYLRHAERLTELRPRVLVASLHGAGGTSAALGPQAARVQSAFAAELGLAATDVPWHVARDGLLELSYWCAGVAATSSRLAREVIDLARTEVGEVSEADGHHRGASSTMPQKANPILSEAVIGMATCASALSTAMNRAAEAGHERAAGEWQVEWFALPNVALLTSSALLCTTELLSTLQVLPEAMLANLDADGGLLMSEAYMIRLADRLGREQAHDLVYDAVRRARAEGVPLPVAVADALRAHGEPDDVAALPASDYLGQATAVADSAVSAWQQHSRRPV